MAARAQRPKSALSALTAHEKATLLDELLAIRPDLRELAETHAARLMSNEDRSAVADDVEYALRGRDSEELNSSTGYQPGQGYVHPVEAAAEILDEELESFLDDLDRRAKLGMEAAAVELAVGILLGLYQCRDAGSETLLEYAPDYAPERAADVVDRCQKLGIALPIAELFDVLPEWTTILGRQAR
jgi:hypothetical protein